MARALAVALLLVVASAAPSSAQVRSADWLRTVRDTPLLSGPADPADRFTTLPTGSFLVPRGGSDSGRLLVYYPGDGQSRQPGLAWVTADDVAPSGPPPWLLSSELDGDAATATPSQTALHRVVPVAPPPVTAPEVAVVDEDSGLLLYGRQPHAREAPASTTKIVTALVALQHIEDLDDTTPITVNGWAMAAADGSSIMGLSPGQHLRFRTLLYGLLLPSGNDAAEQLARSLAESRAQYVDWMNDVVGNAGLKDTHFVNPSGLDAEGHYASAYDLAQVARLAMRDPTFRTIVATPTYKGDGLVLDGHNPLLGEYDGADGVKTGTTDAAGHAIVGSAVHNGHRVYVVVMHSEDLLADCSALFDWTWQAFAWS
jgi:serine-type D-Ala-D-Ala carboxypeptidase (penicillin-binding protein 5/6)